jgi:ribulose-phosphate 3-epimerase
MKENLDLLDGVFKKLHIDIMDGLFVDNLSFGPKMVEEINNNFNFEIDLHLMVIDPMRCMGMFKDCHISSISIHCETINKMNDIFKNDDIEIGLALNPSTDIPDIDILSNFDYLLILGVNPGFGGQEFLPETLAKLQNIENIIHDNNLDLKIQCDGGINKNNIQSIIESGANQIVVGSGIFKGNIIQNVSVFNKILTRYD